MVKTQVLCLWWLKVLPNQVNLSYFKLLWCALYSMIVFCGRFSTLFSVSLNQKGRIILFSHTNLHTTWCHMQKNSLEVRCRRILTPESSKKFWASGENWTEWPSEFYPLSCWRRYREQGHQSLRSHHNIFFFCTVGMNIISVYLSLLRHESWHDTSICCGSILTLVYFVPSGGKLWKTQGCY